MVKALLTVLAIFATIATVIGVVWNSRMAQAVTIKLNVKDLPEHSLSIITASDPAFDDLMAVYQERHPAAPIKELKPFTIFIKNSSARTVVAFKLKWECMKADGTIIEKIAAQSTTWALTNPKESELDEAIAEASAVIRPDGTLFFSLAADPTRLDNQTSDTIQRDTQQESFLKNLNAELVNYTTITVSLDGVFFDDGTYVGPDSTGYFAEIKAQVDAKYHVLNETGFNLQQGKSKSEVFKRAQEQASGPDIKLRLDSTSADYYSYYEKAYAQETLGMLKSLGDKKALEQVNRLLSKPWPQLRKL